MPRLKEIEVGLGVSIDTGKSWVKPNAKLVLEIDVEDSKNREAIWNQAWSEVTRQVTAQINELVGEF